MTPQPRFASWEDVPALKSLWQEAFGDSKEYLDFYFSTRFSPGETLVLGQPVNAMLTLLPAGWESGGGENMPVRYVYAVATRRSARSRGLSTLLMRAADSWMKRSGIEAAFLVPAEESLFAFYARQGYQRGTLALDTLRLPRSGGSGGNVVVESCSLEDFCRLRGAFFSGIPHISWDSGALGYAYREILDTGGKILKVSSSFECGYVVCSQYSKGSACPQAVLKECALSRRGLYEAADALYEEIGAQSIAARIPGGSRDYGMAKAYTPRARRLLLEGAYLGLALD